VRNAEKLGGYYEVPMTVVVRTALTVGDVARFVIVAMKTAVPTVFVIMMVPMPFLGLLFIGCASFDMDMGNLVSRVAVPQSGAKPRYGSCV
jgi:hypothetical protein